MSERTLIAVVDDEPTWLAAVGRALSREGFHALLIGDAHAALEQIPIDRPAAIIVDYFMPSMNGPVLAERLRAQMGAQCPPMVLVTGDLGELTPDQERLFEAAYEKPVSLRRVIKELRRLVRGSKESGITFPAANDDDEASSAG